MYSLHKGSFALISAVLMSSILTVKHNVKPAFAELADVTNESFESVATLSITVDPMRGNDSNYAGTPLKTITKALSVAQPGTVIKLQSGTYSSLSGESFPLVVPAGVSIVGNDGDLGQSVVIEGGSTFASSWWGRQNATIVAKGDSSIRGVAVTNPEMRGTGIWVESSSATIINCFLTNSLRDGIFVAGKSSPTIQNNRFVNNSANGLTVSNYSTGIIADNQFENTGFGISISEDAAPKVRNNRILSNVDGIVISHRAKPQILGNQITNNDRDGIVIIADAAPMLGSNSQPGRNLIKGNGRHAVNNASTNPLLANSGNDIQELKPSAVTEAAAKPSDLPVLEGQTGAISALPVVAAENIQPAATEAVLPGSLSEAKSISIDGKKYISIEDMLRLLQ